MRKYVYLILVSVFVLACGKAEEAKQKVIPKTTDTSAQAKTFIQSGMEHLNNQDVINAIRSFDNAIKVDPKNSDNYMVLGQVYLRLKNYDKAVDTFNAGTRVAPDNGELFYFLGAANAVRYHMADGSQANFYRDEGIIAAKRSVEIFVQEQDEEKFKRALALLKSLQDGGEIGAVPGE